MGDIHGNLIALEQVVKLYINEVDIIISHGDVVNYGPWSNECVELLDSIGVISLRGNHEQAFINGYYDGKNTLVQEFFNKTYQTFVKHNTIEKYNVYYENEYFISTHTLNDNYFFPDSSINELVINKDTIIGHSHYSFIRLTESNHYIINTGSIGQNRTNINIIEFCLFDSILNTYEIKQISYDARIVINQMIHERYPINCINYYKSKLA